MYKKWLKNSVLASFILLGVSSFSQQKTDTLKEFKIESDFAELTTFTSLNLLDSNANLNSLNKVLEMSSPVYVKNYGKGQLATLSIRGNGASQTQLFWNGFKMNSPTLGQTDLSLIPTFFIANAKLNYSGASSANGSGGIGGSVQLKNKLSWKKGFGFELQQEFASFTNSLSGLGISFGGKKLFHQFKIIQIKGVNDFEYVDISKQNYPKSKQVNNAFAQYGAQYELGIKLNSKNLIQSTFTYFNSRRELPPIIGGVTNNEIQKDASFRSFVSWKSFQEKFQSDLRLSYLYENLNYTDSISNLFSEVGVNTYQGQYRFEFDLMKKIKITTSIQNAYSVVNSNGFEDSKTRNEAGLFFKASQKLKKWKYEVFARQELVDDKISPLIYGAGLFIPILKNKIQLKTNFSTNYRVPTLNDLYWNPGGNPNLNPEKGWTGEIGMSFKNSTKKRGFRYRKGYFNNAFKTVLSLTGFYNQTTDWIQWKPTDFGYWIPQNVKNIENKGVEFTFENSKKFLNLNLSADFNYSFTHSRNISFETHSEELVGKQTIYVPMHKANASFAIKYKKVNFHYTQIYNGKVYINADNSSYLPHYFPANFGIDYFLNHKKTKLKLGFNILNLYNEPYHVVANRPIPGRNYSLTLKLIL